MDICQARGHELLAALPDSVIVKRHCLDIGAGPGWGALALLKRGAAKVTAYDMLKRPLDLPAGVQWKHAAWPPPRDIPAGCGLIWCHQTLEHQFEPAKFLRTIKHALAPDGLLALSVPMACNIFSVGHVSQFTLPSLAAWLHDAGMDSRNASYKVRSQGHLWVVAGSRPKGAKPSDEWMPEPMRARVEATGRCHQATLNDFSWPPSR